MRTKLLISLLIALAAGASLFTLTSSASDKSRKSPNLNAVDLENAIIIRGIALETDQHPDSVGDEGEIILDNDFARTIAQPVPVTRGKKRVKSSKSVVYSGNSLLRKLRKKDARWHFIKYKIQANDNLWKIARRYGISHRLIIQLNAISKPDRLLPGRIITVPSKRGIYYTIKNGDTLSGISQKHSVPITMIRMQNNIKGTTIRRGQRIFLPGAKKRVSKKMSVRRRSASKPKKTQRRYRSSNLALLWPLHGKITSRFGRRKDPFSGKRKFHCGIDISANVGTPVKAALDGTVIFSGWKQGYGKVVVLRHKKGYITVYAHNSKNLVKKGVKVSQGMRIARSGMTGAVTGAHLHFELRKYLTPLNPMRFL